MWHFSSMSIFPPLQAHYSAVTYWSSTVLCAPSHHYTRTLPPLHVDSSTVTRGLFHHYTCTIPSLHVDFSTATLGLFHRYTRTLPTLHSDYFTDTRGLFHSYTRTLWPLHANYSAATCTLSDTYLLFNLNDIISIIFEGKIGVGWVTVSRLEYATIKLKTKQTNKKSAIEISQMNYTSSNELQWTAWYESMIHFCNRYDYCSCWLNNDSYAKARITPI